MRAASGRLASMMVVRRASLLIRCCFVRTCVDG
jgi:hypothetical protein